MNTNLNVLTLMSTNLNKNNNFPPKDRCDVQLIFQMFKIYIVI